MEPIEIIERMKGLADDQVMVNVGNEFRIYTISNLLCLPADELLRTLVRDMPTSFARLQSADLRAVNDIAVAKILTYLIKERK